MVAGCGRGDVLGRYSFSSIWKMTGRQSYCGSLKIEQYRRGERNNDTAM